MVTFAPETLVTTYLEMTNPQQLQASFKKTDAVRIERMDEVDVHFYRYLYQAVGEKWCWRDRLIMSHDDLEGILNNRNTHVYVLYVHGSPAGYVELNQQEQSTEIAYFGLREEYHGQGLGKHLLSFGIKKAWELGTERVWLHTCNLDGPYALANYQKRGFKIYDREHEPMPSLYQ